MTDPNRITGAADVRFIRSGTADARTVGQFRNELSQWLRAHFALGPMRLNDVLLSVNEALTNAAEFAYLESLQRGTMTMRARFDAAVGSLMVVVSDGGTWRQADPQAQSNTRGHGIPLMHALADRATISPSPTGTQVRLQFDDCAPISVQSNATLA